MVHYTQASRNVRALVSRDIKAAFASSAKYATLRT